MYKQLSRAAKPNTSRKSPYGADWPEVADEAEVIFVCEKEPHEAGDHFYFLLAYDAEGNEVGRKQVSGWET